MQHTKILFSILPFVMLYSCSSNEIGNSKDVAQDKIYQQYNVDYKEGDGQLSCRAQFRFAGHNGTTLVLSEPSAVTLDGQSIGVDSSDGSGAYYKTNVSTGNSAHNFIFTDVNKKAFENNFSLNEFKLINIPATASKTQPLVLGYSFEPAYQLKGDDYIEIATVDSDSSFSITVNEKDKPGIISIPVTTLKKQTGKELKLQATLVRRQPLKQSTPEGGEMKLEYALKPVKINVEQ